MMDTATAMFCLSPEESAALQGICPVCGKPITIGVANRVAQLADRPLGFRPEQARPYQSLVPLPEVIADCLGVASSSSVKVKREYEKMLHTLGPELKILRESTIVRYREGGWSLHG